MLVLDNTQREVIRLALGKLLFTKGKLFCCPMCGSTNFRKRSPRGPRICGDDLSKGCRWEGTIQQSIPDFASDKRFLFHITDAMYRRGWTYTLAKNNVGNIRAGFLHLQNGQNVNIEHSGPEHEAIARAAYDALHWDEIHGGNMIALDRKGAMA